MAGRLDGRVAIITGATSGIGEATAVRFVEEGARVVLTGRSEGKGKALAARLGSNAVFCRTDVTHEADCAAMAECARLSFGRLDILFNNAGASTAGRTIEEITQEAFTYDIQLLLGSVIFGTKYALPLMKAAGGGSIINNASIAGMRSGYGPPVYSAAKGAVIQLTRSMAMELAPCKIRVNAISPGAIQTPIFARALRYDESKVDETLGQVGEVLKDASPLGEAGMPDDIAHGAVFLASDEGRFVNGHNLVIDGAATIGRKAEEYTQILRTLFAIGHS